MDGGREGWMEVGCEGGLEGGGHGDVAWEGCVHSSCPLGKLFGGRGLGGLWCREGRRKEMGCRVGGREGRVL